MVNGLPYVKIIQKTVLIIKFDMRKKIQIIITSLLYVGFYPKSFKCPNVNCSSEMTLVYFQIMELVNVYMEYA